uniref:Matrix metalloproteinase n=1 Tax=Mesotes strigatus TaxID=3148976 RepID=H2FLD5_9SAUR|nr:matrix metalloproteinase [Thamnodynastes strigatus]
MRVPSPAFLLLLALLPLPCPRAAPMEGKGPLVLTFPGDAGSPLTDRELAVRYLQRYGYLTATPPGGQMELETPLKALQKQLGLPETGELDAPTLTAMRAPRCGVPDVGGYTTFNREPKWDHTDLTYRVVNYSPDLDGATIDDAFSRAFGVWGNQAPLTFTRREQGNVDILIQFVSREHGDGNAFDGQNGVLAHAYAPGRSPISGDAHFDEDELWTLGGDNGFSLFLVAAHEFGHSLGLGHSNIQGALMFPTYAYQANFRLHSDDIAGIQYLYGQRAGPQSSAPLQPLTEAGDSTVDDDRCSVDYLISDSLFDEPDAALAPRAPTDSGQSSQQSPLPIH